MECKVDIRSCTGISCSYYYSRCQVSVLSLVIETNVNNAYSCYLTIRNNKQTIFIAVLEENNVSTNKSQYLLYDLIMDKPGNTLTS